MSALRLGAIAMLLPFAAMSQYACGGSNSGSGFTIGGDDGGSGANGSGAGTGTTGFGTGNTDGGGTGTGTTNTDCSDASKLVYVVSEQNDLYSFEPAAGTFTKIGTLNCDAGGDSPNSMAVDRTGTAWVNYSEGTLFKVSTADASCQSTPFVPGQHGFGRFGMAFSANSAGSTDETLYVVGITGDNNGQGLASIDLTTFSLNPIGNFTGSLKGQGAELTGTGDGKLYGFFTTSPNATLAEIDKTSGATPSPQNLTGVSTGEAWAFSFWGGDFWFYTSDGILPSEVQQLHSSSDNSISTPISSVPGGFMIVGAGVSTCAPIVPPTTK